MSNKNAFSKTNQLKVLAGAAFTDFITKELRKLVETKIIKSVKSNQSFRHKGYAYEKAYKADFIIQTIDDKFIVVRNTTSYRQDRVKTSFYDLQGINENAEFSKDIIASVFIVPDKELGKIAKLKKALEDKEQYAPASHVLILSEFIIFLEEYKYDVEVRQVKEKATKTAKEKGSLYGKRGNAFEKELAEILSSRSHLKACKSGHLVKDSLFYKTINQILKDKGLAFDDVIRINATNTVPLLRNGGNPKTDLVLSFETFSDLNFIETISLKNTAKNRVSCHDYTADTFIDVLQCKDTRLAEYLTLFQKFPTYSAFQENLAEGYSKNEFSQLMKKQQTFFIQWALRGMHDNKNLTRPALQISNYLLISNGVQSVFYKMDNYIELIKERFEHKFGVPFSWTYPSKQRGKRIQLKMPVYFK